jgi:alpha-L-fucosidase
MNQLLAANSNQPGNRFSNKEVMNNWKAQNWVPEKLVALYKRLGTQYFFAMANHHDNLDLLNIPVRGDGTIDEKEIAILEGIARWMDINKESIFDTRLWKVYRKGPVAEAVNPIN